MSYRYLYILLVLAVVAGGCRPRSKTDPMFRALGPEETGLQFANRLKATPAFNMFRYMYFYNGAGAGTGDLNGDGRPDLIFAGNQAAPALYINEGELKFRDATKATGLTYDGGWNTGVSIADVNSDGRLDIYLCRVSGFEELKGANQLWINEGNGPDGTPRFREAAADWGISFSGFSTQAAFFDYDRDGDLDLYLLNHSVHQNGTFGPRKSFVGTYHPQTGDRLYRNEGTSYSDVTRQSGIHSSAIGYGLGITVSDLNNDGWPDLYIGNDFHENDYLYINGGDGTFRDELTTRTGHTSQFSMGVDAADINNDGLTDLISVDMLPSDPYILKRSLGEDEYNIFHLKVDQGYHPQFARNCLQLARPNGKYSETGVYSGVHATDWSWAPLFIDFDGDGLKDLFISNGIPKRLNDIDYVNYVSNGEVQTKIRENRLAPSDMAVIDGFPQIKLPNRFYLNRGEAQFEDLSERIEGDGPSFSNGTVSADFDGDGDPDLAVNNIDDPVILYENKSEGARRLRLLLQGPAGNPFAVGARVVLRSEKGLQTYEKYPVRGFLSSSETPLVLGLGGGIPGQATLIWPDGTSENFSIPEHSDTLRLRYRKGLPAYDFSLLAPPPPPMVLEESAAAAGLTFRHRENPFNEFDREPLIPGMLSREGPALAIGDLNGDGLEDVFLGGARNERSALYVQSASGGFLLSDQPGLDRDSAYEDVSAAVSDLNGDGHGDLVVVSGGNEFYGEDSLLHSRVYLNNGKGTLVRLPRALPLSTSTGSVVAVHDFSGDGRPDLFLGGRAVPYDYGKVPRSYLLQNEGDGRFRDVTGQRAPELAEAGFVTGASWADLNGDRQADLVLSMQWGPVTAFLRKGGIFSEQELTAEKGWWNFVLPLDADGDGDMDLLAGNGGTNTRMKGSKGQPLRLYHQDFDGNGRKEQLITYYLDGKEVPFASKMDLEKVMPGLKKKFLFAEDFAKAGLQDLYPIDKLNAAATYTADHFLSSWILNDGPKGWRILPLPAEAQWSPLRAAVQLPDGNILLGGNFREHNIQVGWSDADYGGLLYKGPGGWRYGSLGTLTGEIRQLGLLRRGKNWAVVAGRNNDAALLLQSPFK